MTSPRFIVERLLAFQTKPDRWEPLSAHYTRTEAENKLRMSREALEAVRRAEANIPLRAGPNGRTIDYRLVETVDSTGKTC